MAGEESPAVILPLRNRKIISSVPFGDQSAAHRGTQDPEWYSKRLSSC